MGEVQVLLEYFHVSVDSQLTLNPYTRYYKCIEAYINGIVIN